MSRETGIMVPFFQEIPMRKRLELIKKAGFNSLVMSIDKKHERYTDKLENIINDCKEIGLGISSAHAPYKEPEIDEFWDSSLIGDDIEKKYLQSLRFAKKHGIKTVVFHLHSKKETKMSVIGLNRLKNMLKYAERYDVNIAIENLYKYDEIDYIFSKINSKNLGFCYDTGHENFLTPGLDVLTKYPEKLMALHLSDNNGKKDQHASLFSGTINWEKVAKELSNAKSCTLGAEVKIHRPKGVSIVTEKELLELYKREYKQVIKLKKLIEKH